jgi:glycerophosphoryl diester phosphodiesterase
VHTMRPGALKDSLTQYLEKEADLFTAHPFSIGHRGASLQFPEHTTKSCRRGRV